MGIIQSATRMGVAPWDVAAGLSHLPASFWRSYMGLWMDWSAIVSDATAQAEKILSDLENK